MRQSIIILLIYIMLSPSALAIDMYFSASSGPGSSVAIIDSYQVSDGVEVRGGTRASFDRLEIIDSRWMEGAGSADAFQRYAGSGGYTGMSRFSAEDALIRMVGGASLKAEGFGASQAAAFEGSYGLAAVGATDRDGSWAETSVEGYDGRTKTIMTAATGSAGVTQETESSGETILDTQAYSSGGHSATAHSWVFGDVQFSGKGDADSDGAEASQTATFEGGYGLAVVGATDRDGDWAETSVEAFDTITRTRMIAATGSAGVVQETESSGSEIHLDTRTHSSGGFSAATHSWVSGGDIRFSGMGHADPEEAMAYQRSEGQGTDVGITTSGFYYDPRRDWLSGDDYTEIYSHVSDGSVRSESLVRTDGDGSASWQDLFAAAGEINLKSQAKEFHIGVPGFIRDEEHSIVSVDIQPSGGTEAEFSGRMTASMGASTEVKLQGVLRGLIYGEAEANNRTATVNTDGNWRLRMESQTDDDYVWMEIDTEEI